MPYPYSDNRPRVGIYVPAGGKILAMHALKHGCKLFLCESGKDATLLRHTAKWANKTDIGVFTNADGADIDTIAFGRDDAPQLVWAMSKTWAANNPEAPKIGLALMLHEWIAIDVVERLRRWNSPE